MVPPSPPLSATNSASSVLRCPLAVQWQPNKPPQLLLAAEAVVCPFSKALEDTSNQPSLPALSSLHTAVSAAGSFLLKIAPRGTSSQLPKISRETAGPARRSVGCLQPRLLVGHGTTACPKEAQAVAASVPAIEMSTEAPRATS